MKSVRFVLWEPSASYSSNEYIRGYLIFENKAPVKLNLITIELEGFLSVTFRGTSKNGCYSNYRTLVKQNACVWMQQRSDEQFQPGIFTFDFSFWIPDDCLSSFSSAYGTISYRLKAKLVDSKGIYKYSEIPIKVYKPFNIMENPTLMQPKTISTLNLSVKPKITIPRSIFIIGQNIPLKIEFENNSVYPIKNVVIGLTKRIIYKGKAKELPYKEYEKTIEKVIGKQNLPFHVLPYSIQKMEHEISSKIIKNETINDSSITINYFLFAKFFTKEKGLCSALSLPIIVVTSVKSERTEPPPIYVSLTDPNHENTNNISLSVHPPPYEEIL
jgi:hypothetical protein